MDSGGRCAIREASASFREGCGCFSAPMPLIDFPTCIGCHLATGQAFQSDRNFAPETGYRLHVFHYPQDVCIAEQSPQGGVTMSFQVAHQVCHGLVGDDLLETLSCLSAGMMFSTVTDHGSRSPPSFVALG